MSTRTIGYSIHWRYSKRTRAWRATNRKGLIITSTRIPYGRHGVQIGWRLNLHPKQVYRDYDEAMLAAEQIERRHYSASRRKTRRHGDEVIRGRQQKEEAIKRLRRFLEPRIGKKKTDDEIQRLLGYGWARRKAA